MAKSFSFSSTSARVMTFADMKSFPMTEFDSDRPILDDDGRQLHSLRGITLLIDGGQIPESTIQAPSEIVLPAGSVVAPADGPASVTVSARRTGERSAALAATARAPRWEIIGQADLASLLAGAASSPEKPAAHGKGGEQR